MATEIPTHIFHTSIAATVNTKTNHYWVNHAATSLQPCGWVNREEGGGNGVHTIPLAPVRTPGGASGVESDIFAVVSELQRHISNMWNCNGRFRNRDNCNGRFRINPSF